MATKICDVWGEFDFLCFSFLMYSLPRVEPGAPGKHRVSTRISRARVFCKWRADLWDRFLAGFDAHLTGARHLSRASFFPAKNWEIWRASKFCPIFKILPDFQNFSRVSKFCPIFKISPNFQNFAQFSKFRPIFKISPNFQNFTRVSKFCPSFKIWASPDL